LGTVHPRRKEREVGFFNRRNAFLGWLVWTIGKRVAKRKAKAAIPSVDAETNRPNLPTIVLAVAGACAAAYFWLRRKGGDDTESIG
jgi:uncharacterized protein (UPF0303 family)